MCIIINKYLFIDFFNKVNQGNLRGHLARPFPDYISGTVVLSVHDSRCLLLEMSRRRR